MTTPGGTTAPQPAVPAPPGPHTFVETKEQRAWYWYDWANSAYVTTTATVLFGPYLTSVATEAACPGLPENAECLTTLSVLGLPVDPGSLAAYTITVSTIVSAVFLIFVGAIADRTTHPTKLFAGFAWVGSLAAAAMFFVAGTNWALGVLLLILAQVCLGASLVIYDSLLVRITPPDDRDRVSSKGWAFGYLGGGLLLAINFALITFHTSFGLTIGQTTRISLLSAGIWWAAFTVIPVLGLRHVEGTVATPVARSAGVVGGSLRQLRTTFRDLRNYPQTMLFLLAYLFFNDGIQTVIGASAVYGKEELGHSQTILIATILMVQFVAFGGALLFGRLAQRHGAKNTILAGLVIWSVIVTVALFLPAGNVPMFLALGAAIGVVLGGTQALARSYFSLLIPCGKEAEYFSFYHAMDRGTSWFGTATMAIMLQMTGSYRPAIFALIVFFVLGGLLLWRVDTARGIRDAGNTVPAVV